MRVGASKFCACGAGRRGQRTTCDPTWRPAIVYIATMMAVVFVDSAVGGGMEAQWMGVGSLWFGEAFRRREASDYIRTGHQPQKGLKTEDERHTHTVEVTVV